MQGTVLRQWSPRKRNAVHQPAITIVVVDRTVPHSTVIPECNGALLPMEAAGEFGTRRMAVKKVQERLAFIGSPAPEPDGVVRIDIEDLLAAFGVAKHNGMHGLARCELLLDFSSFQLARVARAAAIIGQFRY